MNYQGITKKSIALRATMPVAIAFAAIILAVLPYPFPYFSMVFPGLTIIFVFYWSIYRADLMPPMAVFGLGMWQDLLTAGPLGLSAVILLAVQMMAVYQQRFFLGKTFLVEWLGFGVIAAAAAVAAWLVYCIYMASFVHFGPHAVQGFLTIMIFPVVRVVCMRIQHWTEL